MIVNPRRFLIHSVGLCFALLAAIPLSAQPPAPAAPPESRSTATARVIRQRHALAKKLIAEQSFAEATRLLQSILEYDEDVFFTPDADNKAGERSLKIEALRMLGELPTDGREVYEKQYGSAARKLLDDAVRAGNADLLELIVRRYFHTQAGYESLYRLAADHFDHERPLAAALCFERLQDASPTDDQFEPTLSLKTALAWRRAGREDKAFEALAELRRTSKARQITLGGRMIDLFDDADRSLAWLASVFGPADALLLAGLDDWSMFRGDTRRNAASTGGSPYLNRGWRMSSLEGIAANPEHDATVQRVVSDRKPGATGNENETIPALSAFQPLVVRDVVVLRTFGDVRAYDLATGRLVWATGEKDDALLEYLRFGGGPQAQVPGTSPLAHLVVHRGWSDSTFGSLSSDGSFVFAVEDVGLQNALIPVRTTRSQVIRDWNRLVAYDVRSGKAVWEAGGPRAENGDDLAGAYFLGSPLVLDRRLYVLAESAGEIRLIALEPQTGKVGWSQSLCNAGEAGMDFYRRQSGLSPSYDGGILVCPTGSDQVVAIDLINRSLLWRYRFRPAVDQQFDPRRQQLIMNAQMNRGQGAAIIDQNRWLDSGGIISGSRVLFTPRDSNDIFCLDLLNGTLVWKRPRAEGLFVAGVHGGKVLLVGRSYFQALNLADGQPAWPEPTSIPTPSGRGFTAGDSYHLPLATAEVATIDLRDGRIVARSKSLSDRVPGNLVCVRGAVVSQGVDFIESYRQIEALEAEIGVALKNDPDDSEALSLRGEIRLQRGKVREAYADLKRALELKPNDAAARNLLLGSLLEGLRVDFPTYRNLRTDIEPLLTEPSLRAKYLWLQAAGLQRAGEKPAAFDTLLQLAEPEVADFDMERLDPTLSVRRDRLVRARSAELYASASPADRDVMSRRLRDRANDLAAGGDPGALGRFLLYFGDRIDHPDLLRKAASFPLTDGDWLADEFRLRRLEPAGDSQASAIATARLASILLAAERPRDAIPLLNRLEKSWPGEKVLDGQTGAEFAAEARKRPPVERALAATATSVWPVGKVEVERMSNVGTPTSAKPFIIPWAGERSSFFEDVVLEVSNNWKDFVARDPLGHPVWSVSLKAPVQPGNIQNNRAYACDHFVLASVGVNVIAIDTLGTAAEPGARVLWQQSLTDFAAGNVIHRGQNNVRRKVAFNQFGMDNSAAFGPVTRDVVCLQRGRKLSAVETLTGKPLWIRDHVASGQELFGDEELVFSVSPEVDVAMVYRLLDGSVAGERKLPPFASRVDFIGRRIITWTPGGEQSVLALHDPWTGRDLWKQSFPKDARMALIDLDEAAILSPDDNLRIVNLMDGESRFKATFDPQPELTELVALRSSDRYLVIGNEPLRTDNNFRMTPINTYSVYVHGQVHSLDRNTGKRNWSARVERQAIDPYQPSHLPVLSFLAHSIEPRKAGSGLESQFGILCLDNRTGKILYDDRRPDEPLYFFEYAADPDLKQVDLRLVKSTIRFTFSDKSAE